MNISHTPSIDEHHSDFFFALNDAFKRARRQLDNRASRLQGEIKHHEPPAIGMVTKLFEDHGLLESANGLEIYFHKNSILGEGFSKLRPGMQVTFVEEKGENGPQASTIKL
jgi:cold shock CspA family protein